MSDFNELARRARIARLIDEAIKAQRSQSEHDRLMAVLRDYADRLQCTGKFDLAHATGHRFDPEPNPDVEGIDKNGCVFVGDAKDGENEAATRDESRSRIFGYLMAFATLFHTGRAEHGYFAIATNTLQTARGWAEALNLAAPLCRVIHIETAAFTIHQHDPKTWIVW